MIPRDHLWIFYFRSYSALYKFHWVEKMFIEYIEYTCSKRFTMKSFRVKSAALIWDQSSNSSPLWVDATVWFGHCIHGVKKKKTWTKSAKVNSKVGESLLRGGKRKNPNAVTNCQVDSSTETFVSQPTTISCRWASCRRKVREPPWELYMCQPARQCRRSRERVGRVPSLRSPSLGPPAFSISILYHFYFLILVQCITIISSIFIMQFFITQKLNVFKFK